MVCAINVIAHTSTSSGQMRLKIVACRSTATGAALGVLGGGLLARMIGDGLTELGWLRWLSPFGMFALGEPYAHNRLLPLLILLLTSSKSTARTTRPADPVRLDSRR